MYVAHRILQVTGIKATQLQSQCAALKVHACARSMMLHHAVGIDGGTVSI
jgi:hypothetical protein